ncbi:protein containing Sirohem synthase [mine drainage metagenome]|uniref:precorrin-2 dehydrogenase n=1 Tax=mine drainage metagenome TaxID=410659 RepID=T0ZTN8_9ZZZZ
MMLPVVIDLAGRPVTVVGAGTVGARKVAQLLEVGAVVTVIAETVRRPLPSGVALLRRRRYQSGDLAGAFLVVAATGDHDVDDAIVAEAAARGQLLNVVDDATRSSFYFTALHRDGDVVVSVSTSGSSPALASWIRDRIAASLPSGLGVVAQRLSTARAAYHAAGVSTESLAWRDWIDAWVDDAQWVVRGPSLDDRHHDEGPRAGAPATTTGPGESSAVV